MSKRTVFTSVTALPAGISRETVLETLRSHTEMIDLNPLVEERHPIKPPPNASPEEFHCQWYSLTDRVQYLPGGMMSGKVTYTACFHDLEMGLQTHVYAPMGLNIKEKWTLGGSLPGEPIAPIELGVGAPLTGLYLREDVDMKCNFLLTGFVKKTLQNAHSSLVDRLMVKAQIMDVSLKNQQLSEQLLSGRASATHTSNQNQNSDNDAQSYSGDKRRESTNGLHSPPHNSGSFHGQQPDNKDITNDTSLYPQALSIRSSNSNSWDGSTTGSQIGRDSQAESTNGSQDTKVGWNKLNATRVPAAQHADPAAAYRTPTQAYRNAAPFVQERPDPRIRIQESAPPRPQKPLPHIQHGPAELE